MEKMGLGGNPFNCDCEMKWLVGNHKIHKYVGSSLPTCDTPETLKGQTFKEASQLVCGGTPVETTGGQKMTLVLVLLGLCGSVFVVGFFYARHRNVLPTSTNSFFNRQSDANPQLGYANLPTRLGANGRNGPGRDEMDDGDENRLEDDFNRPEFV